MASQRSMSIFISIFFITMMFPGFASQAKGQDSPYEVSPIVTNVYSLLDSSPQVKKGVDFIKADHENTIAEQKQICEIPAPPFKEQVRAADYQKRLTALGLKDVQMDKEGNVFGIRPGAGKSPKLLVCAHLDTVFPEGTDVKVKEKDGNLYAPGITDDSRGLAALLSIIRAFNASDIKTVGDLVFCGNVGEEGLGDLRGVKALFRDHKDFDGFISIEGTGTDKTGAVKITYLATGSHRYLITYKGEGGHSFLSFGRPSAIHAMGRAITQIADLKTPKEPKTTFTVGVVSGGTSVNSIAAEASMEIDMRSNSEKELLELEAKVLEIVKKAAVEENNRWGSDKITAQIKMVGDRPAGAQPPNSVIVQAAWVSTQIIGQKPQLREALSTDANLPISLGIPALAVGGGGKEEFIHSPGEWFDPTDAYQGPQRIFLTILGLVGVDGVSGPLLSLRK
jgi:tripeptide aminopeptidase